MASFLVKQVLSLVLLPTDDGHNVLRILDMVSDEYVIFHLKNENNGESTQVMELYGRVFSHQLPSWRGEGWQGGRKKSCTQVYLIP